MSRSKSFKRSLEARLTSSSRIYSSPHAIATYEVKAMEDRKALARLFPPSAALALALKWQLALGKPERRRHQNKDLLIKLGGDFYLTEVSLAKAYLLAYLRSSMSPRRLSSFLSFWTICRTALSIGNNSALESHSA